MSETRTIRQNVIFAVLVVLAALFIFPVRSTRSLIMRSFPVLRRSFWRFS